MQDQVMTGRLTSNARRVWRGFSWRGIGLALSGLVWLTVPLAAVAEIWVVSPEGSPLSLQAALDQAQDGDTIDLLPGEYNEAHAVLENRRLTLRGVGQRPVINGGGKPSGKHKAMWLVRGGEIMLENLQFRGMRAADGEGAAVRLEGGRLTVKRCEFFDNEYGIQTTHDDRAELAIQDSVIGMAPKVVGGLHHLLTVGRIAKLTVSGSRFQQGFEGHLIKSRARESVIAYNFLHDGQRGGASYEIELPAGGMATIIGNVIAQGSESQNRVVVAYGTDGQPWDRNLLLISHNTFINYKWTPAWFLRVLDDGMATPPEVVAVNNLLVGPGLFWLGAPGHFQGNHPATLGMLRDAETYAFELEPGSVWRGRGVDPRQVGGRDLAPKAEFEWPLGTRALTPDRTSWSPGAYQK
jgi:hypothetical protein